MIAQFVDKAGIVFYATSGELELSVGSDGNVSGTFSFEAKGTTGAAVSITSGKFEGLAVGNLSSLGCLLTKYSDDDYYTEFFYDSDGNLVKTFSMGDYSRVTIFSYANEKPVRIFSQTPHYTEESSFTYANERISQRTTWSSSPPETYVKHYDYNVNGKLIRIRETKDGDGNYEGISIITYSGSNVTRLESGDEVIAFSDFDNKPSIGTLLLKAVKNQPALVAYILWAPDLSENNAGKVETTYLGNPEPSTIMIYEYNSAGYPQKITYAYEWGPEVITLTYSGCN